ncbi:hypothetical protein V1525DRAFT_427442 [Lipomyces kononenkoae]|uniref:Uncharacterized protein n=1 Tax=Lipomyces kononenkoae TaxID=34357 RepID=A0ACC3SX15_LIPKO
MAESELLAAVRRPLSPDSQLEIPASREEFDYLQDILEEEDVKNPMLQYDGWRKVAIVVAAPSPLHGHMVGELTDAIFSAVNSELGWCLGTSGGYILMIALEVGLSQSYRSLRAAISYSVCALRCRLGIAMSINERTCRAIAPIQYYATAQELNTAIDQAERDLRTELRNNPYGPLASNGFVWYGRVRSVVETCSPGTILQPTHSFTIVENGQFVGESVPQNLAELKLCDCIPTRMVSGEVVSATPINFFSQQWFEQSFGLTMVETVLSESSIGVGFAMYN